MKNLLKQTLVFVITFGLCTSAIFCGISLYRGCVISHDLHEIESLDIPYNQNLYDKYGIKVYIKPNVRNMSWFKEQSDFDESEVIDDNLAQLTIELLDEVLSQYSDEAMQYIPKTWMLHGDISKHTDDGIQYLGGLTITIGKTSYVVGINTSAYTYPEFDMVRTLHHEIFHSITAAWSQEKIDKFAQLEGSCSLISEYACTSVSEELSEAWAYGFTYDDNIKANYLHETYASLLK